MPRWKHTPAMVAEASPHPAQVERYLWLIEQGWKACQAEQRDADTMIVLHKAKRFAALYPDGSFDQPPQATNRVPADWARAAEAALPRVPETVSEPVVIPRKVRAA